VTAFRPKIAAFVSSAVLMLCGDLRAAPPAFHELDPTTVVKQVRPDYPYEARRSRITGSGIVVLELNPATGAVSSARMEPSTGNALLDQASLFAFRRWKFIPGTPSPIRTPITFTMTGNVRMVLDVHSRPMDDVLANFLGEGTVLHGPMPQYPRSTPWTNKRGEGLYELHVGADGNVSRVKVLKPSGDAIFDEITVATLRKWRLRRGPLVVELPLSFTLAPTKFSIGIPKR
jgi:TonB family protein